LEDTKLAQERRIIELEKVMASLRRSIIGDEG
jgi:hypothetical protein